MTPAEHQDRHTEDERLRPTGPDVFRLGVYESSVAARIAAWAATGAAGLIWAKDPAFWSLPGVPELTDRLGWLDLPESVRSEIDDLEAFAGEVRREGIGQAVLLGMGGSSLAPEIYQAVFGNRKGYPRLTVLDSTHPDAISALGDSLDPDSTLFIVASKSGTTVESLSLFKYFYRRLSASGNQAGSQFIAITDPETPLEDLARERGFRRVFRSAPDVGGRYSALTHFGLVPAALIGVDLAGLLRAGRDMAARCRLPGADETNPGLMLGATLGELALAGRDKITFFASASLTAFPGWLEQLIAESTGKDGKGIVPVVDEPMTGPECYADDRVFVYLALSGEVDPETDRLLAALAGKGHPVLSIELAGKADLAGEMFRWEMGVAAAGAVLGIHPFNQPDVQEAKSFARQAMSGDGDCTARQAETVMVDAGENLATALRDILGSAVLGDYLCIQAYIAPTPSAEKALQAIRRSIRDYTCIPTTVGFGPRFLHSTGQLHKGGPNTGIFIQLVDQPARDMEVPETDFTFGRLISAQALGDHMALTGRQRRLVRIDLGHDARSGLAALRSLISSLA
jgi:transaldolase/glucose-6-phosphate isomerase